MPTFEQYMATRTSGTLADADKVPVLQSGTVVYVTGASLATQAELAAAAFDASGLAATDVEFTSRYAQIGAPNEFVDAGNTTFLDDDDNTLFQVTANGTQIWGEDDGVDLTDGKHTTHYRAAAVILGAGEFAPRVYSHHFIAAEAQNPGNFIGRRYEGGNGPSGPNGSLRDKELAQTTLAVAVADITAAAYLGGTGELTLTDVGTDNGIATDNTWPAGGSAQPILLRSGSQRAILTYTGVNFTTKKLSGVTLVRQTGSTAFSTGVDVTRLSPANGTLALFYGQAYMGKGVGFQDRSATLAIQTAEVHCDDFYSGFYSGSRMTLAVNSMGPHSQRVANLSVEPSGMWYWLGSWGEDVATGSLRRFVFNNTGTTVTTSTSAGAATIPIDHPAGFPTAGTVLIENNAAAVQTITYTGISATAGQWNLTGCAGGSGTLATGVNVRQAKTNVVAGFRGNVVVQDFGGDADVILGKVGPTTADPEGGIQIGAGSGAVRWYRTAPEGGAGVINTRAIGRVHTQNGSTAGLSVRIVGDTTDRVTVFGNGSIFMKDGSAPSTPTGGGQVYVLSGALKYIGSAGTITTLAPA